MTQIEALDETLADLAISTGAAGAASLASSTAPVPPAVEPRSESLNAGSAAR